MDATSMNRGQRRRAEAQQRAEARRVAAAQESLSRQIGNALDLLRALASVESGVPAASIGVVVEGERVRIYDTRTTAVVISPRVVVLDEVDAKAWEPEAQAETVIQVEEAPV